MNGSYVKNIMFTCLAAPGSPTVTVSVTCRKNVKNTVVVKILLARPKLYLTITAPDLALRVGLPEELAEGFRRVLD
jgi:hypothetical protein